MDDEQVLVPPEVRDGLDSLQRDGALDATDRQTALETASERDLEATVRWLEKVGDAVYERAARGAFAAADESEEVADGT